MTPAILTVTSKDTVVREQLTPQPYLVNGMSLADTQAAIAVGKSHTPLPITNPILLNSPVCTKVVLQNDQARPSRGGENDPFC
jgi:hypothetical protein